MHKIRCTGQTSEVMATATVKQKIFLFIGQATKNVAWRIQAEGYGQSSPVIWKDFVYITSSKGDMKETLVVSNIRLSTGEVLWKKEFASSMKHKRSRMVAQSAPTPAVDEKAVYAFFESGDLVALDHQGTKLWQRNLTKEYGAFKGNHGVGSLSGTNSAGNLGVS